MRDPFTGGTIPIPLAGKWGPVKTFYSHAPLLYAYPPPPFPISVLPVLSPSFLSHCALVFLTSSSLSYLLGSFFLSHFPHLGNLMFLTVEKHVFLSKLRMDAISLRELPHCSPKPASTAPEGPNPSTGVSCSSRRLPQRLPRRHGQQMPGLLGV